jgi:hypothetical protein
MAKWCITLMVVLLVVGFPELVLTQEKPEKPDAIEQETVELQVVRGAVAAGISDREPVDPGQVFSPNLERIYYFTEVRSDTPSTEITHIWYYGDREMARVTLPVEGSRWRTWSSKQILPEWTGQWLVEAVAVDGTVLASQAFSVESAPTREPGTARMPEPGRAGERAQAGESGPVNEPEKR